jgi:flavin reductase (DIM6/NTAB) family NADH-FMN oxidoreductase RutF
MELNQSDFTRLDTRYRANFFNTLAGFKSANLIGTYDENDKENLAVFNSVIHLGANPALMGFILRPTTVERHTYENIKKTGFYTINHVHEAIIEKAHHTSAKYPSQISEFEASGLHAQVVDDFKAPFVKESIIKVGLEFRNEYFIKENDTRLIVGEVVHISIPKEIITADGSLDLPKAQTVAISGLDSYLKTKLIKKLSYARPKPNNNQ